MEYQIQDNAGRVTCRMLDPEIGEVCKCEISIDISLRAWNINSWFTKDGFMNHGYGKKTMKHTLCYCMDTYGEPESVKYTWNGTNAYVLEWLERHFDAVCDCPIAVQKTQSDDDWDSHKYTLNKEKLFRYFNLE